MNPRVLAHRGPRREYGAMEPFLVVAVATILTIAMTYPIAIRVANGGRIDSGDGQWSIWVVNWVARTLVADPRNVFNANIFYPHEGTLAYSETNLVNGALVAPVYWATRNPYLTHNVLLLLSFVLAGASMYYLARYLTGSRPAAAVAGVIFAFCPYVFVHTAHIHLLMTAGLPLSLLAFHRLADAPSAARALVLGGALAVTGLSCGYYGVYAALVVSLSSAYYFFARRYWRNGHYYAALALAALVAFAVLYPFLKQYGDLGEGNRPVRELKDQYLYSANWPAYLASAGLGHRWMLPFLGWWSDAVFPGFLALVLAASGAWIGVRNWLPRGTPAADPRASSPLPPRTMETLSFYGLMTLAMFWLSWGPKAGLYSLVFHAFPYFSLLRAPVRMAIVVQAGLAILAAVAVAAFTAQRRRPWAWAAVAVLVILVECTPVPLRFRDVPPPPTVYATLATLPRAGVLEMPFFWDRRDYHRHTYYMRLSTLHWMPLVNGYSDHLPPDFAEMAVPAHYFPTLEAFAALRPYSPRYVVFHLNLYDHVSRAHLLERIAQFKDYLRPLASDANTRLYEITGWPGGPGANKN